MICISVIIPVHNSQDYLKRCVESVINQTESNWELILVDDGSTDSSSSIVDYYVSRDTRIIAIHQDNAGPGAARNVGISMASGNYIVFIDSDDYIENDYFERLLEHDEDVVFIDIDQVDKNGNYHSSEYMSHFYKLSKESIIRKQLTGSIPWGGVRKAVKRELLDKYNISFSKLMIGEEYQYSFLLLYYANSISFINGPLYKYVVHNDSQSAIPVDDPWGPIIDSTKELLNELDLYSVYADSINAFAVTATAVSMERMANNYPYLQFKSKAINRIDIMLDQINNGYKIDFKSMDLKAIILYPFMKAKLLRFIYYMNHLYQRIN